MTDASIHPSASIAPTARLGQGVRVGPFSVIEDHVEIGDETVLDSHVVVRSFVRLGARNRLHPHVVLGGEPQDVGFQGEETRVEIGDDNVFREAVTVHRATRLERPTRIGSNCMLMVNAHVAHDCRLGDHVLMTNDVNFAGHVEAEDHVIVGGGTQVHQHVRIGCFAMVSGSTGLSRDALPYTMLFGILARHVRLNTIGLRRAGIKGERYKALERAFRALRAGESLDDLPDTDEIRHLRAWLEAPSKRGLSAFVRRGKTQDP